MALDQRRLTILQGAFVGAVLDFDAHRAAVPRIAEDREEPAPLDIP